MYIIEETEIKGFSRILLSCITSIKIRFVDKIFLLIGTNGCGKTSLLRELTLLPGDNDSYLDGGYKKMRVTKDGHTYLLESYYNKGKSKHSFIKDGVPLNELGTMAAQKILIKNEFNYTEQIRDIMFCHEPFHSMSEARRKEIFSELCPVDYTFVYKTYDTIRESFRDNKGALKNYRNRLVREIDKLIPEEEINLLREEIKSLHVTLESLYKEDRSVNSPRNDSDGLYRDYSNKMLKLYARFKELRLAPPNHVSVYGTKVKPLVRDDWGSLVHDNITCIEDIHEQIKYLDIMQAKMVSRRDTIAEEAVKISSHIDILKNATNEDSHSIVVKIEQLKKDIEEKKKKFVNDFFQRFDYSKAEEVRSLVMSHISLIEPILLDMPENQDRRYNSQRLSDIQNEIQRKSHLYSQHQVQAEKLQGKVDHTKQHTSDDKVECPKCQHRWIIGIEPDDIEKYEKEIATHREFARNIKDQINELETEQVAISHYGVKYKAIMTMMKLIPQLNEVWNKIHEENMIYESPKSVLFLLYQLESDLALSVDIQHLMLDVKKADSLFIDLQKVDGERYEEQIVSLEKKEEEIYRLNNEIDEVKKMVEGYRRYERDLNEAKQIEEKLKEYNKYLEQITEQQYKEAYISFIEHCIRQTQTTLSTKAERLQMLDQQQTVIEQIRSQIKTLEEENEFYQDLIRALSPSEGIIAASLHGFVRWFIAEMNQFVESVWAYPLIISLTDESEDGNQELSYLFPLESDGTKPVKDVKFGSSGMIEIINLAFIVVAAKCFKQDNSVLHLDEWGKTFDDAHRNAAASALKMLLDSGEFNQVFMISHYASVYGTFSNADICVLDGRNIVVPSGHNQHVEITRS